MNRIAVLTLFLWSGAWVCAQGISDEFQVNTVTTGDQTAPAVASAPDGVTMVVWTSDHSDGSDTDGTSIQARLLSPDGTFLGDQFQVNTETPGSQVSPAVAAYSNSGFFVTWTSGAIKGRRYYQDGLPYGDEFQISTGNGRNSTVDVDSGDNVVVAFNSDYSTISGLLLDSEGVPQGGQFGVPAVDAYNVRTGAAASMSSTGEFVIAWIELWHYHTMSVYYVAAQEYSADGSPIGSPERWSEWGNTDGHTCDTNHVESPSVDYGSGNVLSASWSQQDVHYTFAYCTEDPWGISGWPINITGIEARGSTHAKSPNGDLVIVWKTNASGVDWDVWAEHTRNGVLQAPILLSSSVLGDQVDPDVAVDAQGDAVAVWSSAGAVGTDTDGWSIAARRTSFAGIFADDFETGDLSGWSGQVTPPLIDEFRVEARFQDCVEETH